jgi:LDH2 family malate/lactate/ureidoglycolate dehydrogenase
MEQESHEWSPAGPGPRGPGRPAAADGGCEVVSWTSLQAFCVRTLEAVGATAGEASVVSDSLVDADLRGLDSHGVVARLPSYVARVEAGGITTGVTPRIVSDHGTVIVVDAGHTFGQVAARAACEVALERADQRGMAAVAVRDSNHLGALGYWTRMLADRGMVGFAVSGAAPRIAPWGGAAPLLSTNPWSFGFPPAGGRPPVIVDVSGGVVLSGALETALEAGERIPHGWALDADGKPTNDPASAIAGSMLPFGDAKGAALLLSMELIGSVLTGAAYSRHVPPLDALGQPQLLGQLFLAMSVERFMPLEQFEARADELLGWIESSPPREGFTKVRVPGARGQHQLEERRERGIPGGRRLDGLHQLAGRLGIESLATGGRP